MLINGELNMPYILAINFFHMVVKNRTVSSALFDGVISPGRSIQWRRNPVGAWTDQSGWQKTRMSGVLLFKNMYPHTITRKEAMLWTHPAASYPVPADLPLNKYIMKDSDYVFVEGKSVLDHFDFDGEKVERLFYD